MFAKKIHKKFEQAKNKNIISNYRVFVSKTTSLDIGITNDEIAGPYNPITISTTISGDCLIQWKDGLISSANFSIQDMYDFDKFLTNLKLIKYKNPAKAIFLGKQKYPDVKLYNPEIANIFDNKEKKIIDFALLLKKYQDKIKTKTKEINVCAEKTENAVFTSKKLFETTQSTLFNYSSYYDEKIALQDCLRKIPEKQDIENKRKFIEQLYLYLKQGKKIKEKNQEMPVILAPWVSEDMFSHFVISNLYGSSVYNKQSCFSVNDFKIKKQILKNDLELSIDPLIDFNPNSYKFTTEGVPAQKTNFIKNGRLENQILNLKYAKLQKTKPTGIFNSQATPLLKSKNEISFEKCLRTIKQGIIICNILGLHTQNPAKGDYSIPCPDVLYIKNHKIIGRARVIINGNFLKNMNQNKFQLIKFSTENFPGFLMKTKVNFEIVK